MFQQLIAQAPSVKSSDRFTDEVMSKLPARNPLRLWSCLFMIFLWVGFGAWVWWWHADLVQVVVQTNWNLRALRLDSILPYFVFIAGLGILLWQTIEFLSKNILSRNELIDASLSHYVKK